jgi:hypothetical protein
VFFISRTSVEPSESSSKEPYVGAPADWYTVTVTPVLVILLSTRRRAAGLVPSAKSRRP